MHVAIAFKCFPVCLPAQYASNGGLMARNGALVPREENFGVQNAVKQAKMPPFWAILAQSSLVVAGCWSLRHLKHAILYL